MNDADNTDAIIERQDWSEGRLRLNGRSVEPWNGWRAGPPSRFARAH